jgi:energy-coupling factor transport system substrate-specific component
LNAIAWIQGLQGLTLVAIICAFLFLEETGVPIPFAPGDLLLAIAGIAIAAGRVNPAVLVACAFVAIVTGAGLGREVFAVLGWDRLMKVAGPLHARVPLERASAMLQRNGWRAVFTARLIPGLRVHTTEVAGVSRMPRLTFMSGLLPATAVYVAAFVGLGAAFGRPILRVIHEAEHQLLILIACVAVGALLVVWSRSLARRALASAGGWTGVLTFRLDSPGIILIPACVGIDFAGRAAAVGFKLPLFLDSIGTILCGVLAGPWVGGSVGFIANLVSSNTVDPIAAPYSVVSFAIGFSAGLLRYLGRLSHGSAWLALWPVLFLVASVVSTPLNMALNEGRSGVPLGDAIFARLSDAHIPLLGAAYVGEATIDLPDKLLTVLGAFLIYRSLPAQPAGGRTLVLDVGEAFVFAFRSRRSPAKVAVAAACLLFSWLLFPLLLFVGYTVSVARSVRAGATELPAWDDLRGKLKDGVLLTVLLFAWALPGIAFGLPADLAGSGVASHGASWAAGALNTLLVALAVIGSLWGLFVLVAQGAIWSQYLRGGFRAGLNVADVLRRVRFNLGLTFVVAALVTVLAVIGFGGLLALLLGVLVTLPYCSWVGAYLLGRYASITDEALLTPSGSVRQSVTIR